MNFLLEKDKKTIKREYYRRFFVVAGVFSVSALLVGVILFLPVLFFFKSQETDLARQVAISQEMLQKEGKENAASFVKELNSKVSFLGEQLKSTKEINPLVENILEVKPEGLEINNLYVDTKKITVQGLSNTRQNLLLFLDNLKKESFKNIESPISNIIKEKNIEFTVNIEL